MVTVGVCAHTVLLFGHIVVIGVASWRGGGPILNMGVRELFSSNVHDGVCPHSGSGWVFN